jgi:hypothetical protein
MKKAPLSDLQVSLPDLQQKKTRKRDGDCATQPRQKTPGSSSSKQAGHPRYEIEAQQLVLEGPIRRFGWLPAHLHTLSPQTQALEAATLTP